MGFNKLTYLDFDKINALLVNFEELTGIVSSITDLDGNILSQTNLRRMCTEYHRKNPIAKERCKISERKINEELKHTKDFTSQRCLNGLYDVVAPIIIGHEHIANIFSGQFLIEEPDRDYFRKQAVELGFPIDDYLEALSQVPIFHPDHVRKSMIFLQGMIRQIIDSKITEVALINSQFEQQFLSRTAIELVGLSSLEAIYHFTQKNLSNLIDESGLIIISEYFYSSMNWNIKSTLGTSETMELFIQKLGLMGLQGMKGQVKSSDFEKLPIGKLQNITETFPQYLTALFPEEVHESIDNLLHDKRVLNIVLEVDESYCNLITILLPVSSKQINTSLIEAFIAQISNYIKKLHFEEVLRQTEQKMLSIYRVAPIGIGVVSEKRIIMDVNPRLCSIIGFTKEELIGKDARILYPTEEDFLKVGRDKYAQIREYGSGAVETRWKRKDSKVIDILLASTPIDINDFSKGVTFTALDITDRKQAEEALLESQKTLQEAQRISHVGNWGFDIATNRIFASEEGFHIYGLEFRPDGIIPIDEVEACIPDKEIIHQALIDLIEQEKPYDLEFRICPADGSPDRTIISKAILTRDKEGNPQKVQGILQDITERKQAEEEQRKLKEQLLQSQKLESIGRLAGGIAHDFNNMLGVIQGYTEMSMDRLPHDHPIYRDLQEILKASERSAELTKQLLTFARKQTISPKVLDLNSCIEEIYMMLKRLIGEEINLVWRPCNFNIPVLIDPIQIDQILANICVNARDSIDGAGFINISTELLRFSEGHMIASLPVKPGRYVRLTIADNGCGMDTETLNHIFEPFYTTKGIGMRSGLGFSMVFGIVKQNDGHIEVLSEIDSGTTIHIYFPYHGDEKNSEDHFFKTETKNKLIMLVEDEKAFLALTQSLLERIGYRVLAFDHPQKAIDHMHDSPERLDLLITDVVMPGLNGRQVVEELQGIQPDLRYLYISGYTADILTAHDIKSNESAFIQKPFSIKDMAQKVKSILRSDP